MSKITMSRNQKLKFYRYYPEIENILNIEI